MPKQDGKLYLFKMKAWTQAIRESNVTDDRVVYKHQYQHASTMVLEIKPTSFISKLIYVSIN